MLTYKEDWEKTELALKESQISVLRNWDFLPETSETPLMVWNSGNET